MTKKTQENSLKGLTTALSFGSDRAQVTKSDTLAYNTNAELLFQNRSLLSYLYTKHGIIQTLIDQPVDDAFRTGFDIKSDQLSRENIDTLEELLYSENIIQQIAQACKWGRLFGGSGLVVITNQPNDSDFNIEKINEFSTLRFYPADLWELNLTYYQQNPNIEPLKTDTPYMFYGLPLHKSRVLKFKGKEAPSFVRPRFRGWGMSEVERLINSFNQYLKNNGVIFELLDEAKIDVYKIKDFNSALMTEGGTKAVQDRVQMANTIKNYINAITMDMDDDYQQKQMNFSGLSEVLKQVREGIASDLRMPVTKLFGVSSAGFNSGEDDIENYNSMVESEVRAKCKHIIINVLKVLCKKNFDFIPDDLMIEFRPLRILGAEQEENVKTQKLNRILAVQAQGLISAEEAKQAINKASLLPIEIDESDDLEEIS